MTTISPFFSLTPTGSENYSIAPLSISHSLTPTGSENYSIAPLSIFTNGEGLLDLIANKRAYNYDKFPLATGKVERGLGGEGF